MAYQSVDGTLSLRELIKPHSRQEEFLQAFMRHKFTLYGGARGGGKSYILRWALVKFLMHCTQLGFRRVRVGIFCSTYNELYLRQIDRVLIEFGPQLGKFLHQRKEFRFVEELGGHVIQFCNMEDLSMYQGGEFAAIAVDELTLCADRGVLDILRACLRWPEMAYCPFIAATNPTGPGHSWCKRLWITKDFSSPEDVKLNPDDFVFVRSLPTDNPYLSREYIEENLGSLPEYLREPWLNGSWDILAGQRFQAFRHHVHTCDPFDLEELGPVEYFRSIDYGTHDPYACGWYGVVNTEAGM